MALRFYFDTHIAKAAAEQLRARGIEVIRCEEVGMADASDEAHLEYATEHGCVMVSKDADFTRLHIEWQRENQSHGGILKLPREADGEMLISLVVTQLSFYHEAEVAGAINYSREIQNILTYL